MHSTSNAGSPGLAKVRAPPLVRRRVVHLAATSPGRLRDMVADADVVSEGRTLADGDRLVYYGSTSVLLLRRSAGGEIPDADVARVSALLRVDPHARLLVTRVAQREAAARAGGTLGTLRVEIEVAACARGVSLLVEVVGRLCGLQHESDETDETDERAAR